MTEKMYRVVDLAGFLTMLSGLLLYWRVSGGFQAGWITSGTGLALTIGGVAGLLESFFGATQLGSTSARITALGKEML